MKNLLIAAAVLLAVISTWGPVTGLVSFVVFAFIAVTWSGLSK